SFRLGRLVRGKGAGERESQAGHGNGAQDGKDVLQHGLLLKKSWPNESVYCSGGLAAESSAASKSVRMRHGPRSTLQRFASLGQVLAQQRVQDAVDEVPRVRRRKFLPHVDRLIQDNLGRGLRK